MAEANKTTKVMREDVVTLKLSKDEAEALTAVLAKIGGDRHETPRRHTEAVSQALTKAGVRPFHTGVDHPFNNLSGGLSFSRNAKSEFFPF